ncbi:MAG: hypothetical protein LBT36_02780 [Oscillospiraceae bacterium]|jgi:hypothetical protein|nr:hypothetical protein [Oscillospiraceae bacterium]
MPEKNSYKLATYLYAPYLAAATPEDIEKGIEYFEKHCPLDKVYLEPHRDLSDVPEDKILAAKALFAKHGIETAGGITATVQMAGHEKKNIFSTFCYTDPAHRERYMEIVEYTARLFDEIILDDFFFTSCRCPMCIDAKTAQGKSWARYRLDLMEDVSRECVARAKKINPKLKFVIKYPNWYESYQECGYNPDKQKDIFDGIYTGTETRGPKYNAQHLQRYMSYSLVRYLENTAPGRNGGGWIDTYGLDTDGYVEQAELTLFAKAEELMLFNFEDMKDSVYLAALGHKLGRVNSIIPQLGNPVGVPVYDPQDSDGEDQLYNWLGMLGLPFEPTPRWTPDAPLIFLTQSAAYDGEITQKLEQYVRAGGAAVVTTGFFKAVYDKGIKELTSVRLTGRHARGSEFSVDPYMRFGGGNGLASKEIGIEILDYKTNASWCELTMYDGDNNFPLLVHDYYGDGDLYILNVPENFADVYALPAEVTGYLGEVFATGQKVSLRAAPKHNLFLYDNGVVGVYAYGRAGGAELILRDPALTGVRDLETGWELKARDGRVPLMVNGGYKFYKLI